MLSVDELMTEIERPRVLGWLVARDGPQRGQSFPICEGDNVFGRSPECEVRLLAPTVARRHGLIACRVAQQGEVLELPAPATGTFFADRRLRPGDPLEPQTELGAIDALGIRGPALAGRHGALRRLIAPDRERIMFGEPLARIACEPSVTFELHDYRTTNGTWVNGRPVSHALLFDGDELCVGGVTLRLVRELGRVRE